MTQENALKIFKSLSDMSRLRIIQSLTRGEMYTELLAERLGLTPSTVSFHMKKLEEAGLVVSRKEQYYTVYSLNRNVLETSLFDVAAAEPEQIDEQQKREKEYRQKVIDSFFEYGKLKAIPVQRKKKLICYEVIAESFVPGKVYSEKELNDIIAPIHEDYCTIRHDMIGEGILGRNGSEYVRLK
ncbi:MAG: metalloregulator ArsR/SmtB family transcription factor [Oscillospiraceae bacterium]|nr:metalloregulator ArsR/SmtB family transcription factor [Oscillospiraceae bacterium]